jgi:hypothetical protein
MLSNSIILSLKIENLYSFMNSKIAILSPEGQDGAVSSDPEESGAMHLPK